jgi:hypothetical protein
VWIQIDAGIHEHDKIYNLADMLDITNSHAVGLMVSLWAWAATYAPDGDITNYPPRAIAKAAGWHGEPDVLYEAMRSPTSLFVETTGNGHLFLRNWHKRAGLMLDSMERKKEQTRKRVQRHRESKTAESLENTNDSECNADVTRYITKNVTHVTRIDKDKDKYKDQDQNICATALRERAQNAHSVDEPKDSKDRAGDMPKQMQALFDTFWKAYPKKRNKGDARKAWKQIQPSSELLTKMLSALERAKTCDGWIEEGGRYIPYPASWLRAEGWEDVIAPNRITGRIDYDRERDFEGVQCGIDL